MDANKRKILEDAGVLYPSVVTNADRIRAMSDEELAKSIARIAMCVDCKIKNPTCTLPISNCEKSWLEWLKQEADT